MGLYFLYLSLSWWSLRFAVLGENQVVLSVKHTQVSDTEVVLSWSLVAGISLPWMIKISYTYRLAQIGDCQPVLHSAQITRQLSRSQASLKLTGLEPWRTYHYKIKLPATYSNSEEIVVGEFSTKPVAPPSSSVRHVTVSNVTLTTADISWQEPPCVERNGPLRRFDVQLQGPGSRFVLDAFAAVYVTISNMQPGTQYGVRVRYVNTIGSSNFTPPVTFTTASIDTAASSHIAGSRGLKWTDEEEPGDAGVSEGKTGERGMPDGNEGERKVSNGNAGETEVSNGNAGEKEVPTGSAREREVPTGSAEERKVPIGSAGEKEVPTESAGEREVPTGSAREREVPGRNVGEGEMSTGNTGDTWVSSGSTRDPDTSAGNAADTVPLAPAAITGSANTPGNSSATGNTTNPKVWPNNSTPVVSAATNLRMPAAVDPRQSRSTTCGLQQPCAPYNVRQINKTLSCVVLAWDTLDVTGMIKAFDVYDCTKNTDINTVGTPKTSPPKGQPIVRVCDFEPGKFYLLGIRSRTADGRVSPVVTFRAHTEHHAPPQPNSPTLQSLSSTTIQILITGVTSKFGPVTSYYIIVGADHLTESEKVDSGVASTPTGLWNGQTVKVGKFTGSLTNNQNRYGPGPGMSRGSSDPSGQKSTGKSQASKGKGGVRPSIADSSSFPSRGFHKAAQQDAVNFTAGTGLTLGGLSKVMRFPPPIEDPRLARRMKDRVPATGGLRESEGRPLDSTDIAGARNKGKRVTRKPWAGSSAETTNPEPSRGNGANADNSGKASQPFLIVRRLASGTFGSGSRDERSGAERSSALTVPAKTMNGPDSPLERSHDSAFAERGADSEVSDDGGAGTEINSPSDGWGVDTEVNAQSGGGGMDTEINSRSDAVGMGTQVDSPSETRKGDAEFNNPSDVGGVDVKVSNPGDGRSADKKVSSRNEITGVDSKSNGPNAKVDRLSKPSGANTDFSVPSNAVPNTQSGSANTGTVVSTNFNSGNDKAHTGSVITKLNGRNGDAQTRNVVAKLNSRSGGVRAGRVITNPNSRRADWNAGIGSTNRNRGASRRVVITPRAKVTFTKDSGFETFSESATRYPGQLETPKTSLPANSYQGPKLTPVKSARPEVKASRARSGPAAGSVRRDSYYDDDETLASVTRHPTAQVTTRQRANDAGSTKDAVPSEDFRRRPVATRLAAGPATEERNAIPRKMSSRQGARQPGVRDIAGRPEGHLDETGGRTRIEDGEFIQELKQTGQDEDERQQLRQIVQDEDERQELRKTGQDEDERQQLRQIVQDEDERQELRKTGQGEEGRQKSKQIGQDKEGRQKSRQTGQDEEGRKKLRQLGQDEEGKQKFRRTGHDEEGRHDLGHQESDGVTGRQTVSINTYSPREEMKSNTEITSPSTLRNPENEITETTAHSRPQNSTLHAKDGAETRAERNQMSSKKEAVATSEMTSATLTFHETGATSRDTSTSHNRRQGETSTQRPNLATSPDRTSDKQANISPTSGQRRTSLNTNERHNEANIEPLSGHTGTSLNNGRQNTNSASERIQWQSRTQSPRISTTPTDNRKLNPLDSPRLSVHFATGSRNRTDSDLKTASAAARRRLRRQAMLPAGQIVAMIMPDALSTGSMIFVVGDGLVYNGFTNTRLRPSGRYRIYLVANSEVEVVKSSISKPISVSMPLEPSMATGMLNQRRNNHIVMGIILTLTFFFLLFMIWVKCNQYDFSYRLGFCSCCRFEIPDRFFGFEDGPLVAPKVLGGKAQSCEKQHSTAERHWSDTYTLSEPRVIVTGRELLPPSQTVTTAPSPDRAVGSEPVSFRKEFQALPRPYPGNPTQAGKQNNALNNNPAILPYDATRVTLDHDGTGSGDYINASHITGYMDDNGNRKAYIAAQCPFDEGTAMDTWRAIYQHSVATVVVLTKAIEDGVLKCFRYWPEIGRVERGPFIIQTMDQFTYAHYSEFLLSVRKRKRKNEELLVRLFCFSSWPEKGVPQDAIPFVELCTRVHKSQDNIQAPVMVQCETGSGRTAVFIALDILLAQYATEGQASAFDVVCALRSERPCMVQTFPQYAFLYEAVLEEMHAGDTWISHDLRERFKELSRQNPKTGRTYLRDQFFLLNLMMSMSELGQLTDARRPQDGEDPPLSSEVPDVIPAKNQRVNTSYNSNVDQLPSDGDLDELSTEGLENVVVVDDYRRKKHFLMLASPVPAAVSDFWQNIYENDVRAIVAMEEPDATLAAGWSQGEYWPNSGSRMWEPYLVELLDFSDTEEGITVRTFRLLHMHRPRDEPRTVRQFEFHGWNGASDPQSGNRSSRRHSCSRPSPSNSLNVSDCYTHRRGRGGIACPPLSSKATLLCLYNMVKQWQDHASVDSTPVVVHCRDGALCSGLYVAMSLIFARLDEESLVSVYRICRYLRKLCPASLGHFEQYKFLYKILWDYINLPPEGAQHEHACLPLDSPEPHGGRNTGREESIGRRDDYLPGSLYGSSMTGNTFTAEPQETDYYNDCNTVAVSEETEEEVVTENSVTKVSDYYLSVETTGRPPPPPPPPLSATSAYRGGLRSTTPQPQRSSSTDENAYRYTPHSLPPTPASAPYHQQHSRCGSGYSPGKTSMSPRRIAGGGGAGELPPTPLGRGGFSPRSASRPTSRTPSPAPRHRPQSLSPAGGGQDSLQSPSRRKRRGRESAGRGAGGGRRTPLPVMERGTPEKVRSESVLQETTEMRDQAGVFYRQEVTDYLQEVSTTTTNSTTTPSQSDSEL